ncbi:MAG: G5 domain-containing protein [Bacillota bacterium]
MKDKKSFPVREDRVTYGDKKNERDTSGESPQKKKKKKRKPIEEMEPRTQKNRNPQKSEATKKRRSRESNAMYKQLLIYGVIVLLIFAAIYMFVRKNGVEVFVSGESYGVLQDMSTTSESVSALVKAQIEQEVGTEIKIIEFITTEKIRVTNDREKDVCTVDYLLPKLRGAVTYDVLASNILSNGTLLASLKNEEDANAVLDSIKAVHTPVEAENVEVSFVEDVVITEAYVSQETLLSIAEAEKYLGTTNVVTGTYTVVTGDYLFVLAQKFNTTVENLIDMNPGMTIESGTKLGETINVPVEKPVISVKTVETQVLTTVEPKETIIQDDPTQPSSYKKVTQQGKAGQKQSTIQITRINGFVEEEKEISKEILVEPVTEIIVQGTL